MTSPQVPDLSNLPALKPPPGVIPDFQHASGIANTIIAVNAVFLVLMAICLAARVYVKIAIIRGFWWDDVTFYISEISVAIAVEALCTTAPPNPSLCSNDYKNTIAQACINVVTDVAVLGFPITKVFNLQMPLQRKIRVSAIFGVGLL
ncbi:hypothetical protein OEA41_001770 [Lepraria neglecta]|uniref:Rhodopsin domain-containing protein n=1 Tax=Lepraria neglecta TaxID=209136 RepID=A0AAE0DLN3_9LECA|nr:hypothetical protein OEA41_001770 [Lepraria neglecta]